MGSAGGAVPQEADPLLLWYRKPAQVWTEALPVGNGRLGAMVFGGGQLERLQLNQDTLWSGYPADAFPRPGEATLLEMRRLLMQDQRYEEAEDLARLFQGPFTESYVPLGDLFLTFVHDEQLLEYRRELDIAAGMARVSYVVGDACYTREVFASAVHQVIVVRILCSLPERISFDARFESPLRATTYVAGRYGLALRGRAPSHVVSHHLESDQPVQYEDADGHGMRFEARVLALSDDGRIGTDETGLHVEGATAVTLLIAGATGYRGFGQLPDRSATAIALDIERTLSAAARHTYHALRSAHLDDFQALFHRVSLQIGELAEPDLPTDERIGSADLGGDGRLAALYAQYGRYLLISSSRPGTQPANLQGLWNDQARPVWGSDYTFNINLQMNYWQAGVANLLECQEPLCDLIADLYTDGLKTARLTYGCRGWAAHNGTDIWRVTRSAGGGFSTVDWSMWPMGGVWLCRHLWEHYLFGGGVEFLRDRAYPLMRGAAEFCLDWLIEDQDGYLVTCPSTSPENSFIAPNGRKASVTVAATMDMMLIWDLFANCSEAARVLGVDEQFRTALEEARARLLPPRVGKYGQLQEWAHDFEESEPGHRHMSHLFGLHPGQQITPRRTPALAQAARRSLERRLAYGGGQTGWSRAWMISHFARLGDGDQAHRQLISLFEQSTLPNLFNTHPPFQIDGNFGGAAGIFEMLLQSHLGIIELLPALPVAWPEGSVRGLRARGGFTVDIEWKERRLVRAVLVADANGPCRVTYGPEVLTVSSPIGEKALSAPGSDALHFIARQNRQVEVVPAR